MPNYANLINEIRSKADIVKVISSYIPLNKQGKNYFGVCPFHDDHNPSMSVSPDKQIYKCFVCGASGNVFTFVKDFENVSFNEAVSIVGASVGIEYKASNKVIVKKNKDEIKLMDFVCKYYQNNLYTKDGINALKYLEKRNINEDIIKRFKIGLSLNQYDGLAKILTSKEYNVQTLDNLGLVNSNLQDYFHNRIMFPLCNEDGDVIGFSARIFNNETNQPKYLNTKETILFKKGNFLYNYHLAKKAVKKDKILIIVEGQMDVIRLCQNGFENCIALSGTALTDEQVLMIKKLKVPVYLTLDNDNAGEIATYRNGEILEKNNVDLKVVRLLDYKDPDEFLQNKSKEEFLNYLKKPMSYLSFKMSYLKQNKNLKETKDLVLYINEVLDSLKNEKDDLTIEVALKKLSKEYDLDYNNLLKKLNNNKEQVKKDEVVKKWDTKPKRRRTRYELASSAIIYFMMNDPKYILMYQQKLGYLKLKEQRDIINHILYFYEINNYINLADFISYIEQDNIELPLLKDIINQGDNLKISEEEMSNYINVVDKSLKSDKLKELKRELFLENNEMKKIEIVKEITKLKKEV